jgi:hypothetical protein
MREFESHVRRACHQGKNKLGDRARPDWAVAYAWGSYTSYVKIASAAQRTSNWSALREEVRMFPELANWRAGVANALCIKT